MKLVVTTIFDGIVRESDYLADSWNTEMGYLTLFQDGEECAAFPPSAWRSVVRHRDEGSESISIKGTSRSAYRLMEALQKQIE